jgi:CubicO group peptidase (beta-lactamase class C family)
MIRTIGWDAFRANRQNAKKGAAGMTEKPSRRTVIKSLLGTAAGVVALPARGAFAPQTASGQPTGRERGEMGRIAGAFRRNFSAPALSVAMARNGQFVYDQAIGMAYRKELMQAQPSTLFRIASVTKPITSVAIFTLVEKGQLHLNDKVFGPSGVLGTKYGKQPYGQYVSDVTVDHLLTHTAGGWPNDSSDPMFRFDSWDQAKLIGWALENLPLSYPPGEHWAYSNFGYCVLGRVIEQVTGQPYADYVQANVLAPCGISDMAIARNKLSERLPNEAEYIGLYGEDPYKMNVTRMDSHGGWLATPSDLVIFLDHLGGAANYPSLLKPGTIQVMTTPSPAYPQTSPARYARGWMVRTDAPGTWWHDGSLPGTTSIMVRTPINLCWAALVNTRTEPHAEMDSALDKMLWDMARVVPEWGA